jgi:hypothetical protein
MDNTVRGLAGVSSLFSRLSQSKERWSQEFGHRVK